MLLHVIGVDCLTDGALLPILSHRQSNMQSRQAFGSLIVQHWVSIVFWPLLFPDGCNNSWFIHEVRILDRSEVVISSGKHGMS